MNLQEFIQIITGSVGVLGFCVLFNIRGMRLVMTVLGGFLSWTTFVLLSYFISNDPINYFIVALLISIYAEIMARVLKTPTTTFITAALVPLIPGGSLYYTMAYAFKSDMENFLERGLYTLQLAAALAIGIIVATAFSKMFFSTLNKRKLS